MIFVPNRAFLAHDEEMLPKETIAEQFLAAAEDRNSFFYSPIPEAELLPSDILAMDAFLFGDANDLITNTRSGATVTFGAGGATHLTTWINCHHPQDHPRTMPFYVQEPANNEPPLPVFSSGRSYDHYCGYIISPKNS